MDEERKEGATCGANGVEPLEPSLFAEYTGKEDVLLLGAPPLSSTSGPQGRQIIWTLTSLAADFN